MKHIITCLIVLLNSVTGLYAKVILVTNNNNEGSGSLREAVLNANDDDVITFSEAFTIYLQSEIALGDKRIAINGQVGDDKVILDGNYKDKNNDYIDDDGVFTRIFKVIGQPHKTITINNLIIQNGSINCTWQDDVGRFQANGGGIFIDMTNGGVVYVSDCYIQSNRLINLGDKDDNINQASLRGAGVYSNKGGVFTRCTIRNNSIIAEDYIIPNLEGAGGYFGNEWILNNCLIAGNKILYLPVDDHNYGNAYGAGLYLDCFINPVSSIKSHIVQNCVIIGNEISASDSEYIPDIDVVGAGIISANGLVYNTTIAYNGIRNIQDDDDGEVDVFAAGYVIAPRDNENGFSDFQNSISYNNYSSGAYNDGLSDPSTTNYIAISNEHDLNHNNYNESCILIKASPFAVDPSPGDDGQWGTDDDDYGILRLYPFSECINAGNPNQSEFDYLTNDFYSKARINDNRIDLGAVEFYESDVTFSLQGKVHGAENTVKGKVHAIKQSTPDRYAAECNINEDGSFFFRELTPDTYYLLAIPEEEGKYQPTYYGNELDMDKAIGLNVNDKLLDVDINMLEVNSGLKAANIQLYPNPVENTLHITCSLENPIITVFNSIGTVVAQRHGLTNAIPMQNFPQGYYVVSITSNQETITKRVLKR